MKFPAIRLPKVTAPARLLVAEAAGLIVGLCGIATWSVGAALLTGGVLVVIAIERQG